VPARSRPSEARAAATSRLVGGAVPARSLAARPLPADPRRGGSRRHLRIAEVPTRTPAQRRVLVRIFFLGGAALIVAIAFSLVYLHVVLAQRQFKLDGLNAQVQQEQASYQKLRLQVAELNSPQHIVSTAEGQLGMVQPAKVTELDPSAASGASASATWSAPSLTETDPSSPSTQAPAGDADWPLIKSQLAGSP
jgi:cell division protein FtsL